MKNRKLLLIVSLVLALTMSLGGTLAYLQDSDADVNVMTLGSVTITQNEQERNADDELVPFTPNKPAMPAVGPIAWADEGVMVNGSEYKVFTDDLKNVVDKIVTVTNTGKSDAYVRTIVALEAPDYDPNNLIHMSFNEIGVSMSTPYTVEIDGVKYVAFVFTYADALGAGKTSAPSLLQLFLDSKTTNTDVAKFGDAWEVLVLSQAIQADGWTATKDKTAAQVALDTGFGEATNEHIAEWFKSGNLVVGTPGDKWPSNDVPGTWVSTADALADAIAEGGSIALTSDIDIAKIDLTNVGADVVINGNNKKITTTEAYGIQVKAGKNITISNAEIVMTKHGDYLTYAAGLKIENGDYADATIKLENCKITMANTDWAYAVNMPASVKNLNLVIDNCELEGAIAVQCWGDNNTITITNSKLICNYKTNQQYTSYCVALQGDGTNNSENNKLVIDGCEFAYSGVDNFNSKIYSVGDRGSNNTLTVTDCTYGEEINKEVSHI